MRQIWVLLFLTILMPVHGKNPDDQTPCQVKTSEVGSQTAKKYTYQVISLTNNTWGYDIYKDSKMLIHQTNMPGIAGNEGFKSKSDANKVARLVIEKLEKGEMPPSVTIDEMKKLKILITK